jgi:GST-like protein
MIKFYYNLSPNPLKVALALEEMELAYEAVPVDVRLGEQFQEPVASRNPNHKIPIIVDGETTVFDSNAILLYLAEKTGRFLPAPGEREKGEFLSWLMFVATGLSPFSGQAMHFRHFAPKEGEAYAKARYAYEAKRHYGVLDQRLAGRRYVVGETYTIVDMAVWGWASRVPLIFGRTGWDKHPNVKRLYDEISARPAGERALALEGRHAFKTEFDEEARRNMFRF